MVTQSDLSAALMDWAERISVETCARIREQAPDVAERATDDDWSFVGEAVIAGAALALQAVQQVVDLDMETIDKLVRETP